MPYLRNLDLESTLRPYALFQGWILPRQDRRGHPIILDLRSAVQTAIFPLPRRAKPMGNKAKNQVQKLFTWNNYGSNIFDAYNNILKR